MDKQLLDVRFAIRSLLHRPGFTSVAVLSLAFGIGLNTTIFSVVNAILLKQVSVEDPGKMVEIYSSASEELPHLTLSYPDFKDLERGTQAFSGMAAHAMVNAILTQEGRSELIVGEVATDNYFDLLGTRLALGRSFLPEENQTEGTHPVTVISYGLWQRMYGGDRSLTSKRIRLSGVEYDVVGVTPQEFTSSIPGFAPQFWVPLMMVEKLSFSGLQWTAGTSEGMTRLQDRGRRWLFANGRLREGATLESARAQVTTIMSRLEREYLETNEKTEASIMASSGVRFHPLVDGVISQASTVLLVAVAMVLLVSCANVASMLLARAATRKREMALRLALGANRSRIIQQLMTESLVLAGLGGLLGIALAYWAVQALAAFEAPLPIPLTFDFSVDSTVLIYALLVSLATAVAFGLAPAWRASRPDLVPAIKGDDSGSSSKPGPFQVRNMLVVGQLAISLVLLVAGALLTRGLLEAQNADLGINPRHLASLDFNLKMNGYSLDQAQALQRELEESLLALPGVAAVGRASRLPFAPDINMEGILVPGHHEATDDPTPIDAVYVSSEYFEAVGVPILDGRSFNRGDLEGAPLVAIVNQAMAKRYWPDRSPVGARIFPDGFDEPAFEIVGVARDHKVRTVGEDPRPYVHFAQDQFPGFGIGLVIRTEGPAETALPGLRNRVLEIEPDIVFTSATTASEIVDVTLLPTRLGSQLLAAFGVLALLLAGVGLYGVVAYSVARRTREVGLRIALGADRTAVLGMILKQGMVLAGVGIGLGVLLAALAAQVLQALLYGVSTLDPLAYVGAALLLVLVALVANLEPAWRASRLDPMRSLRYE